ncbi:immunoglobulin kappa light chain-like isoform X2 [Hippoglossus hippoglossus]|uniref:immunoglobulin kappa light chain-like isoform X2 n=1 Tax=Hippoglossus hippoglossus TaxID=8267 RepID=UPI00148DCC58|nr:immunoglobulin kappa light chain-like isoform X2 [Hippoglossus hippoglossus]
MMTSPKFVLYLTCFFLGKMVQMHHVVLSHQDIKSVNVGDNLTLQCSYEERDNRMYWYKQTPGQKPRIISMTYKISKDFPLLNEFKDNQSFTVETNDVVSHLNISDLQLSDSATYYCSKREIYVFEFMESITVSVKVSGSNIQALVHQSESIQPGGSVTLSCTVHTGTCDGEHSVYWFKNSEEPQPGLIYTHGDRNDQCERKPDTQTHTCVSNLSMERLNRSHAGTYYCAVAACGHIVFGDGTKLEFDGEVDWLVVFLSATSAITTLLSVLLAFSICMMRVTDPHAPSSKINAKDEQNEDDPCYIAHREIQMNRSRGQRDDTWSECVYLSVRQ